MPYRDKQKMREYMRQYRSKGVNVNPVNPVNPKPVNPERKESYLLSYSRNKYQHVLYSITEDGKRSLIKSFKKNEVLRLGKYEIRLTWGPEE